MDTALVRSLALLASETDLSEIEVSGGGLRVRISRQGRTDFPTRHIAADCPEPTPDPASGAVVASPMVGTVRRGPRPGAAPFVGVGSRVSAGDRLLVIEAMRTASEVVADRAGTVMAAYVEDGRPVEYGEPLFLVV